MNCERARREGAPYARNGASFYIYGSGGVLFDTPEDIRTALEAARVEEIGTIFYTHWHDDHTRGSRLLEHLGHTYYGQNPVTPIDVYIPENDVDSFKQHCAPLWFYQKRGWARIILYSDRQPITLGTLTITPVDFCRGPKCVRYGFRVDEYGKSLMYAPCSIFGAKIDTHWEGLDALIMETGWFVDFQSTDETRQMLPADHGWQDHVSFKETMEMVQRLQPKQTILTHLDGTRHLMACGDYDAVSGRAKRFGPTISVAYDYMTLNL